MHGKILVVDDEQSILNALQRELGDWAESRTMGLLFAADPMRALEIIEEHKGKIDILLSDLRMPSMTGGDLVMRVKGQWPEIVCLLLSGYSDVDELVKAVKAGIFSYILKPWDPDYLIAELDKALDIILNREERAQYQERIKAELKWAGEMQRVLLEEGLPASETIDVSVLYAPLPQFYCGGDYYDVIRLPEERYLLLVGDVSGHGVTGALVTGILKALIYPEYIRKHTADLDPAAFMTWLNHRLGDVLKKTSSIIVTFSCLLVDTKNHRMAWVSAGHPPAILRRSKKTGRLAEGQPALGFLEDYQYKASAYAFESGDEIVLYTDGLVEIGDIDSSEGLNRLERCIAQNGLDHPHEIKDKVLAQSGCNEYTDDVCIVVCKIK